MLIEVLINYLSPKITEHLFLTLEDWFYSKKYGCKNVNFSSEDFLTKRTETFEYLKKIVPLEVFDKLKRQVVEQLIVFCMQEVAEFIECEIASVEFERKKVIEKAKELIQIISVFEKVSSKASQMTKQMYPRNNFHIKG